MFHVTHPGKLFLSRVVSFQTHFRFPENETSLFDLLQQGRSPLFSLHHDFRYTLYVSRSPSSLLLHLPSPPVLLSLDSRESVVLESWNVECVVHACVRLRGCTLFQRHVHTHTHGDTRTEHVARIHVHPHTHHTHTHTYKHTYTCRIVDERVHPYRRSHRSNLVGSCWNYVTLRRGG